MDVHVKLGDRVKDKITGLKGIAIATTSWMYGCTRITVQPEEAKDGKPAETFTVDEPQLKILKVGAMPDESPLRVPDPPKHGLRPSVTRQKTPARGGNAR